LDVHEVQQQEEKDMGINVHDAGPQRDDYSLIPPGVYRLRARVIAGDAGSDGNLLRAKQDPKKRS
jgi:hypothetical protein